MCCIMEGDPWSVKQHHGKSEAKVNVAAVAVVNDAAVIVISIAEVEVIRYSTQ